jgi:hypothetical protein
MTVEWHTIDLEGEQYRLSFDERVDASRFIVLRNVATFDLALPRVLRRDPNHPNVLAQGLIDGEMHPSGHPVIIYDDPTRELPRHIEQFLIARWSAMRGRLLDQN